MSTTESHNSEHKSFVVYRLPNKTLLSLAYRLIFGRVCVSTPLSLDLCGVKREKCLLSLSIAYNISHYSVLHFTTDILTDKILLFYESFPSSPVSSRTSVRTYSPFNCGERRPIDDNTFEYSSNDKFSGIAIQCQYVCYE